MRKQVIIFFVLFLVASGALVGYLLFGRDTGQATDTNESSSSQEQITLTGTIDCIYEQGEPTNENGDKTCYAALKTSTDKYYMVRSDKELPAIARALQASDETIEVTGALEPNVTLSSKTFDFPVEYLSVTKAEIVKE